MTRDPLDQHSRLLAEVYEFYGTLWPELYGHLIGRPAKALPSPVARLSIQASTAGGRQFRDEVVTEAFNLCP